MAQARWTGLSIGGPTYVEDPRVAEQVALGELLLRSRAAAQAQTDRLFERKQGLAEFDERRRQFNEEQKRLGDAQKMQAADAERRAALEQQRLAQDQAQFGVQQQGAAEDRLFRRDDAAARERLQRDEFAIRQQEVGDRRSDRADEVKYRRDQDTKLALEREKDRATAEARYQDEKKARDLALARSTVQEANRIHSMLADAREQRAMRAQDQALARERETRIAENAKADREEERTKVEGSKADQRKAAIGARAARFRTALQALVPDEKGGRLSEADQANAVRRAYEAAVEPDAGADPTRTVREAQMLGKDGEAEANARLAEIAAEFFPEQDFVRDSGPVFNGPADVAKLLFAAPLLAAEHPDYLNANTYTRDLATWLARTFDDGRGVERRSAGQREAAKLFARAKK